MASKRRIIELKTGGQYLLKRRLTCKEIFLRQWQQTSCSHKNSNDTASSHPGKLLSYEKLRHMLDFERSWNQWNGSRASLGKWTDWYVFQLPSPLTAFLLRLVHDSNSQPLCWVHTLHYGTTWAMAGANQRATIARNSNGIRYYMKQWGGPRRGLTWKAPKTYVISAIAKT